MTLEEFRHLRPGDVIHDIEKHHTYIVYEEPVAGLDHVNLLLAYVKVIGVGDNWATGMTAGQLECGTEVDKHIVYYSTLNFEDPILAYRLDEFHLVGCAKRWEIELGEEVQLKIKALKL